MRAIQSIFNLAHVANKARGMEATKQNVLSLLARLFDPLGIISPVTVSMKILFQEICNSKIDWDEVLTGEIKRKWDRWVQDLSQTGEIQISRYLYETGGESVTECYLHGFGDASKKVHCAMVYLAYRRGWENPCQISSNQKEGCPLKRAFNSALRIDVG